MLSLPSTTATYAPPFPLPPRLMHKKLIWTLRICDSSFLPPLFRFVFYSLFFRRRREDGEAGSLAILMATLIFAAARVGRRAAAAGLTTWRTHRYFRRRLDPEDSPDVIRPSGTVPVRSDPCKGSLVAAPLLSFPLLCYFSFFVEYSRLQYVF